MKESKLQKKPSALKREQLALQNMGFLNFFLFGSESPAGQTLFYFTNTRYELRGKIIHCWILPQR